MVAAEPSPIEEGRARVAALAAELAVGDGAAPRIVETAISWRVLGRSLAFKIKKPVRLPFLDFTSLAERRRCCDEELRLNRRFAPDLYLDVVEVRQGPRGPSFDGNGEAVDVAVRMRRFADGALWSERLPAGQITPAHVDAFARRLAAAHGSAPVAPADTGFGSPALRARGAPDLGAAVGGREIACAS